MTSVRRSHWMRAMKAPPASSQARYQPASGADAPSHLPLSYDDFGVLAAFSDVCAIVLASMATGTAYLWLASVRVEDLHAFFALAPLSPPFPPPLLKPQTLSPPHRS